MYWRQAVVAAVGGASAASYVHRQTANTEYALAAGVICYILIRILFATIFRIQYWYDRGGHPRSGRSCPRCGQYVRRRSGDWLLKCHRCRWTVGLPGLRWITHSVPTVQFRRSITATRVATLVLVVLVAAFPIGPAVGGTLDSLNFSTQAGNGTENTSSDGGGGFFEVLEPDPLNQTEIEYEIHEAVNAERTQRGLSPLRFDKRLRKIARYHSADMGDKGYFSHKSPSGATFGDRYDRFGYDCQVSTGRMNYMTGAENIAFTTNLGNEEQIADEILSMWMNSPGHRENILGGYWNNEGIGVNISTVDGSTRVYATQNFC